MHAVHQVTRDACLFVKVVHGNASVASSPGYLDSFSDVPR